MFTSKSTELTYIFYTQELTYHVQLKIDSLKFLHSQG